MMNDIKFEFKGFRPDEKIENFVSAVTDKLHWSAPSDSSLKFILEKSKNAVLASCRIVSQTGTFMAEAIHENPIRAIQQIETKIRDQLEKWKRHRFESGTLENKISME
jgi:ribosome-associated translation inhibitor RaiA